MIYFIKNKNILKKNILLFSLAIFILSSFLYKANAGAYSVNGYSGFTGYARADAGGLIDMSTASIDSVTGVMSGYVWSDNLGWISFKSSDVVNCPAAPTAVFKFHLFERAYAIYDLCTPHLLNDALSGYIKVLTVPPVLINAGWDGYFSLNSVFRITSTSLGKSAVGVVDGTSFIFLGMDGVDLVKDNPTNLSVSLSADSLRVSYNNPAHLSWQTSGAVSCFTDGSWSTRKPSDPDLVPSGSTSTDNLTSNQVYTLQCFDNQNNTRISAVSIQVCPSENPVWGGNICQPKPQATIRLEGQYTSDAKIVVSCTNSTSYTLTRGDTFVAGAGTNTGTVSIGEVSGVYKAVCEEDSADGHVFSASSQLITYQRYPPTPIVDLKVAPVSTSLDSQVVVAWSILYPGSVQKPTPRTCTLTTKTICTNGHANCSASQLLSESDFNMLFASGQTDANDTGGASRLIPEALNFVVNGNVATGETDWKAFGKKTVSIKKSTDFILNCGAGKNESQTVRVMVKGGGGEI